MVLIGTKHKQTYRSRGMAQKSDTSAWASKWGCDKYSRTACDFSQRKSSMGREVRLIINLPDILYRYKCLINVLYSSFNETFHYQHVKEGPILTNTIVTLSPKTGDVLSSWGAGFFYMPHGITIDHQGNVWVTDVAMHQVFKVKKHPIIFKTNIIFLTNNAFKPITC